MAELKKEVKSELGFKGRISTVFKYPESGVLIAFLIVFIFFSIFSDRFLTVTNFRTIFIVSTELGIMTIGVTFLMIAGEFDLSVGSVFGLSIIICTLLANAGLNSILALIITMIVASIIGLINGVVSMKTYIPSFIATLGMSMFIRGIMLAVSSGFIISYKGDSILPKILSTDIGSVISSSAIFYIALIIIFSSMLHKTKFGAWVIATGADNKIAKQVGVNVTRIKLISFMFAGLMAGFAGMVSLGRFQIADVLMGQGMELEAIAAAVIGGTLLRGGRGSIIGVFLGVLTMGMIRSGLILIGAPAFWYRAFIGIILVLVAIINSYIVRVEVKVKRR